MRGAALHEGGQHAPLYLASMCWPCGAFVYVCLLFLCAYLTAMHVYTLQALAESGPRTPTLRCDAEGVLGPPPHHLIGCPLKFPLLGKFMLTPEIKYCGEFGEKVMKGEVLNGTRVSFFGDATGNQLKPWQTPKGWSNCIVLEGAIGAKRLVWEITGLRWLGTLGRLTYAAGAMMFLAQMLFGISNECQALGVVFATAVPIMFFATMYASMGPAGLGLSVVLVLCPVAVCAAPRLLETWRVLLPEWLTSWTVPRQAREDRQADVREGSQSAVDQAPDLEQASAHPALASPQQREAEAGSVIPPEPSPSASRPDYTSPAVARAREVTESTPLLASVAGAGGQAQELENATRNKDEDMVWLGLQVGLICVLIMALALALAFALFGTGGKRLA